MFFYKNNHPKKIEIKRMLGGLRKKEGISKAREDFFKLTDIPSYMQKEITRMSMYGNSKVYIEQYENVLDYYTHYIRIKCKNMYVVVEGKELIIAEITDTDLIINGKIDSISYKKVGEIN